MILHKVENVIRIIMIQMGILVLLRNCYEFERYEYGCRSRRFFPIFVFFEVLVNKFVKFASSGGWVGRKLFTCLRSRTFWFRRRTLPACPRMKPVLI